MTLNQHQNENYVIIANLKSETMCKLINRIPASHLLISSLPGSASRMQFFVLIRLASLAMSTRVLKALPGKLNIKRHSPSNLYIWACIQDFGTYSICAKSALNFHTNVSSRARSNFPPETSPSSKLSVCEKPRLWQDWAYAYVQSCLSLHCWPI